MLRMLADENFNADIVRGLLLRNPALDLIRVQDIGLRGASDAEVVAWAATNDRIILTHDRATLADHAFQRLVSGEPMAGVFIVNDRLSVGEVIEEVLLLDACTSQHEWNGRVVYLPL